MGSISLPAIVSVLAVRDKDAHELLSVGVIPQYLLDVLEHGHEIRAAASSDLVHSILVVLEIVRIERHGLVVVENGRELLEGAHL